MTDIKIVYDNDVQYGDFILENDDLVIDPGLEASVLISLFTNRRVSQDELPSINADQQGWVFEQVDGFAYGSRLWLLERSKMTDENITLTRNYAAEALQWMTLEGVAHVVDIDVFRFNKTHINMTVNIRKDGNILLNMLFEDLWSGQFGLQS